MLGDKRKKSEKERERDLITSLSLSTSLTSAKKLLRSKSSSAVEVDLLASPIKSCVLFQFPLESESQKLILCLQNSEAIRSNSQLEYPREEAVWLKQEGMDCEKLENPIPENTINPIRAI